MDSAIPWCGALTNELSSQLGAGHTLTIDFTSSVLRFDAKDFVLHVPLCFTAVHSKLKIFAVASGLIPGRKGWGGGSTWGKIYWACAAGASEPLLCYDVIVYFGLFCGQI